MAEVWGIDELAENAETTPTSGVDIKTLCVWAVEYFTPSNIGNLDVSIQRLGLNPRDDYAADRDPRVWIRGARASASFGSGWHHIGSIHRAGPIWGDGVVGPLPDFVESADVYVHHITPSLSACAISFKLRKNARTRIFEELRKFRFSEFVSYGASYSVWGPSEVKTRAVEDFRRRLRTSLHVWYARSFPGFFASFGQEKRPMVELTMQAKGTNTAARSPLWSAAGLDEMFGNWKLDGEDIFQLKFPRRGRLERSEHGILLGDAEQAKSLDESGYGKSEDAIAYRLNSEMRNFIVIWGLLSLIACMRERLSSLRDNQLGLPERSAAKAIEQLKVMTTQNAEIETVCSDLVTRHSDNQRSATPVFTGGIYAKAAAKENYLSWIWNVSAKQAALTLRLDKSVRVLAQQKGTLIVASQNLRLQAIVGWLTVVAAILAGLTAIEPASDLWNKFGRPLFSLQAETSAVSNNLLGEK